METLLQIDAAPLPVYRTSLAKTLLSRRPRASSWTPVILAIGIMAALSALGWSDWPVVNGKLEASGRAVFEQGEVWRVFTAPWIHGDMNHLASNTAFFAVLGFLLRDYYGRIAFPVI